MSQNMEKTHIQRGEQAASLVATWGYRVGILIWVAPSFGFKEMHRDRW